MNWQPATEAQRKALECEADLLLFGGAAGSLKSETMLVDAVQEYDSPRLRAVVFRRTYPELQQLIMRSRELYSQTGGTFNETKNIWHWPWGATMQFAYCKRDEEVFPHQGQQYSYIGWDESTHHSEFQIRYLLSRLRSTDPSMWLRCRLATNPGGEGHKWHQFTFLGGVCPHCQPAIRFPDRVYSDAQWYSDKKQIGMSTAFIFGRVKDHNLLGKQYENQLAMQSGATAKALLEGCWNVFEGQYYDIWEPNRPENPMVVPRQTIGDQYWWTHWLGADYGFSGSQAAVYLLAMSPTGVIYVLSEYCVKHEDVTRWPRSIVDRFHLIKKLGDPENFQPRHISAMYLSPDSWNNRGDNHTLADQMNEVLDEYGLDFIPANNDRAGGAMLIYTLLAQGKLVIADTCRELIDAIPTRIHDEKEPEKVQKVVGDPLDDCFDALRYGVYSFQPPANMPKELKLQERLSVIPKEDITSRSVFANRIQAELEKEDEPITLMRTARTEQFMQRRRRNL